MFHTPSGAIKDNKKCAVVKDLIRMCGLVLCFKVALGDPQHLLTVKATLFKDKHKYLISGLDGINAKEPVSCDTLAAVVTQ